MKRLFAATLALLLMGQASPPVPVPLSELGWMSGSWESEGQGDVRTQETWSTPRGGLMLGYSRTGSGERTREFEFLRIIPDMDGVLSYIAQPGGGAPVGFRMTAHGATSATFDNAQHDFPQRIRYVRTGNRMVATISRLDGSNAMSWTYRRRD